MVDYFNWLTKLVIGKKYSSKYSYNKLLKHLYNYEFSCLIDRDINRYNDGIKLKDKFVYRNHLSDYELKDIHDFCSVLEMMIALSIRCEEEIMDNTTVGDRTGQWFWGMIVSLGLGSMTDERFDPYQVDEILERFITRRYYPDGRGGLFTIKNCKEDLRNVEIWMQLLWYLNSIS